MTIRKYWLVLITLLFLAFSLPEVALAAWPTNHLVNGLVGTACKSQHQPEPVSHNLVLPPQSKVSASPVSDNTTKPTTVLPRAQPDITVEPNPVNFRSVTVGSSGESLQITVRNTGSAILTVGEITIEGPDAADFYKKYDNASLRTIRPRRYEFLWIVFRSSSVGAKSAALLIPSNDPDEPVAVVELLGEVKAAPQIVRPPVTPAAPVPESEPAPTWALLIGVILGGAVLIFFIYLLLKMDI